VVSAFCHSAAGVDGGTAQDMAFVLVLQGEITSLRARPDGGLALAFGHRPITTRQDGRLVRPNHLETIPRENLMTHSAATQVASGTRKRRD
jgi:hypothetical protein